MRAMRAARGLVLLLVVVLAAGCGSTSTPAPSASASGASAATAPSATAGQALATAPSPTATQAVGPSPVAYADTLRIGVNVALYRGWMVDTEFAFPALTFGRLVYGSLYGYDGRGNAVPDLADGPCFVPGSDGAVIRCRLVETTFHDGTPLTADDVVSTYQVMNHPVPMSLGFTFTEVRAVDARTVEFVFPSVDAACLECTLHLPIFPRHSIDEAVAAFEEAGLTAEDVDTLVRTANAEMGADPPVCSEARVAEVDAIYRKLGFVGFPVHHEDFQKKNGEFDACLGLGNAVFNLDPAVDTGGGSVGWALHHTGSDRVASIVGIMLIGRPDLFVGTGPYRYVSQDADSVHLEAFPGYHGGMPATRYIDFVRTKADGSDVVAGTVDILSDPFHGVPFGRLSLGAAFEATAEAHGVRVLHPPGSNSAQLTFNVREGRLFSDVNLRRALQLCIDLPRVVDSATGGAGIPIYSPVMPGSWGDDPDLPKPERDVAAGKRLIEASGWKPGADGVYAKGKDRLAAKIVVRVLPDRLKMADLIAAQARDCGMHLESLPIEGYGDLVTYPHDIPGTETPFDLLLIVYITGVSPADSLVYYTSSQVSDAERPDGMNMGGWSDPEFDRLLAAAEDTYDQAGRALLYRQAQEELAAQLPALFLWNQALTDAVRPTVATVDGPLDLTLLNWAWQPERLVVEKEAAP